MANYYFVSFLYVALFVVLLASVDGRSLQRNYDSTSEKVDLLNDFFTNNATIRGVSLQSTTYTGKTNFQDVLGLVALLTQYSWLEEANLDPCFPPRWTWIQCNSDANPRIIELDLSSKLLIGTLPDFGSMAALQIIDLSVNILSGPIPSFLGTFQDLQVLNLASNAFSGLVPDSLACNKKLKLSLAGNINLYTSRSCSLSNTPSSSANENTVTNTGTTSTTTTRTRRSNTPVILGSTISVFLVISIAVGIFAIFRHKAKTAAAIAEASAQGPNNGMPGIPTEERPINVLPNDMSP